MWEYTLRFGMAHYENWEGTQLNMGERSPMFKIKELKIVQLP